jgi:hypothetical protein
MGGGGGVWKGRAAATTPQSKVSDPDSIRSVEPDPDLYSESGSIFGIRIRIQEAKMTHRRRKNYIFHVLMRAACSLLRAAVFFCNLDVLYRGLGIGKL